MKNENDTKNMDMEKKNKRFMVMFMSLSILVLAGLGFAYFSATVPNTNNEKLVTETATLSLKFDDNDNGVSGTLNLGESITKKFTIQNTGTLDAYAKINWYNLVNTYMNGSLTYNLEQSESEDGMYTIVGSGNVPASNAETTETLKNGILVPVNTTYYYKLTITLNNLENVNQNSDINANFHSYFSLEEGTNGVSGVEKIQNLVSGANTSSLDVITKEAPSGATCTNTLAYDGTVDNNLRYVGANPCNYVQFNNELWRIIGVMNNIDDGTGKKETRIKLVRNETLGNYSWDTSAYDADEEEVYDLGQGVNDWTQADLMLELNGDYLDTNLTANTMWYNGISNQKTGEYNYTKGLKASAQVQISNAKWYLGGTGWDEVITEGMGTSANFYNYERGNDTYSIDKTEWTGKVALIYPSDYGFGTGGNLRQNCMTKNLFYLNFSSDCFKNNWISKGLTITSSSVNGEGVYYIVTIDDLKGLYEDYVYNIKDVYPCVYLKQNVAITGGDGSAENPYTLG